jgi:hypothetical protein
MGTSRPTIRVLRAALVQFGQGIAHSAGKSLLALLLLSSAALLIDPVVKLPTRIVQDFNEGWNAFHAKHAFEPELLYPPYDGLTSNNYPPISYYLVRAVGGTDGDFVIAGRLVALASLFATALLIGLAIRFLGGSPYASSVGSLFFVAYIAAYHGSYIGMNDPQWLGHAFMMLGCAVFVRSGQRGTMFLLSALIMVFAGFIKHTLIPLPISIAAWLLVYDRRAFTRWAAVSIIVLILFLSSFYLTYGDDFLRALFIDVRQRSWSNMARPVRFFLPLTPLMTLLAATFAWRRNRVTALICFYIGISALWAIFILRGTGVDRNAVFDLVIALAIGSGLAVDRLRLLGLVRLHASVAALLFLTIVAIMPRRYYSTRDTLQGLTQRVAATAADIEFLASRTGPAMCEDLVLCYWAGKDFQVDFFNTGQKVAAGVVDRRTLTRLLEERYFAVIQTRARTGVSFRLGEGFSANIRSTYEMQRISDYNGAFLIPRMQ